MMQLVARTMILFVALLAATGTISGQRRPGVMGDLITDVATVEKKILGLANAIPESAYAWRPGAGVRSVLEVLLHVAGENYFTAAKMDVAPPADTGIVGKTIKEVRAYEERKLTRAQTIAALEHSFATMRKAMADTPDEKLETTIAFFAGRQTAVRTVWVGTTTHMHEHLGQLIAYARSNSVVPPWNK